MENVKSFFDSFKEFIWDIIGYLLPGSLVLIILAAILKEEYFISNPLITKENGLFATVFIILSYLIGYVVYSIGLVKEKWRDKKSYTKKIELEVSKKENFKIAKEFLIAQLAAKGSTNNLSAATVRDVRNIAMGFSPEADQKIYTFMFRSEISNHIANIAFIIGVFGWVCFVLQKFNIIFINSFILFKTETKFMILYTLLIGVYFILREARDRFYSIAIGLPFSILVSKTLNK